MITLVQLIVFYFAKNKLIHEEAFMIEFELSYLSIFNIVPLAIMIRTLILVNNMNQKLQEEDQLDAKLDESYH